MLPPSAYPLSRGASQKYAPFADGKRGAADQLGAFFGAIVAFVLGDRLGRKRTLLIGHGLNLVGAVLQFSSYSLAQMVVGRVVNGFGMGMTSTMSPVYLAECATSALRGRLLVIGASSNVTCFCLANWICYGLYFGGGPLQWRFPLAFQLVFALVFPILLTVPESPRWLLLADRGPEALATIARISGADDALALAEYHSIKAALELEREGRVPVADVLRHRDPTQNFRRLLLACGTQFSKQNWVFFITHFSTTPPVHSRYALFPTCQPEDALKCTPRAPVLVIY